jgi:DNA-binding response OmpR family regulator
MARRSSDKDTDEFRLLLVAASEYAETIEYFLREHEISIFHETRGDRVPDLLRKGRPDVLVIDCVTPQIDGMALFRWLRAAGGAAEVPALLITRGRSQHRLDPSETTAPVDFVDVPMRQSDFITRLLTLRTQAGVPAHQRPRPEGTPAPAPAARARERAGPASGGGAAAGRSLMIVDDDPDHSTLLRQLLENEGFKVVETANLDAFKMAILKKPDAILLDLMMPVLDGFVLAEVFKACRLTRHIPIIFLTALHEVQYAEASKQLQAAAYLTKPVTIANLLFTINTVLSAQASAGARPVGGAGGAGGS